MKFISTVLVSLFSFSIFATTPQEAFDLSQKGKAVLIDVREKEELQDGMVKGAKWFPLSKIENDSNWKKEFTPIAKDKKIFLYCRSGRRSEKVEALLKELKFDAENIGGYQDLKDILPSVKP